MRHDLLKCWAILFCLQALLAGLIFWDFLSGTHYFAYLDIASDTYAHSVAHAQMMARQFPLEGWSGWSFQIGLGAPTAWMLGDTFMLLTQLAGAAHVLELRIWVYLLKLALGGGFFLLLARPWVERRESAILMSLAYTFCGYMVVNGQWNGEANFVFIFPMMLWAITHHLRTGSVLAIPVTVAASLLTGAFFLTVGVSLAVAFAGFVAMSASPRSMALRWLTRIGPLIGLGFIIGSPYVLPAALQLLDSPRIEGGSTLADKLWSEGIVPSDLRLLLVQLGSVFHKDLFGPANSNHGFINYLEGPVFYVGMLPLLLIPQMWKGAPADRRALCVAAIGIAAYCVIPAFRLAAFGFMAPYFRSTLVWVTLALALLGLRGLDRALVHGVDTRLMAVGVGLFAASLGLVWWSPAADVWAAHAVKIVLLAAAATTVLGLSAARIVKPRMLVLLTTALMSVEIVAVAWPSYHAGRLLATPDAQPFNDKTLPALQSIRSRDASPFYRIEKTFSSFRLSDAVAQDYMGVSSYYFHGRAVVEFHKAMSLTVPDGLAPANHTNWLPGPGDRFLLHSLLGVKYLIAEKPLEWPGFEQVAAGKDYVVYQNHLALPLGIVQPRQVARVRMDALSALPPGQAAWLRDAALINAAVVDEPRQDWGAAFDLDALARGRSLDIGAIYVKPAEALQRTGLRVTRFSSQLITGTVAPEEKGLLVFSIPAYRGWSLKIDGRPTALLQANYGMLAAPVDAGFHQIELRYRLPGRVEGLALGLLGLAALAAVVLWGRRARAVPPRR